LFAVLAGLSIILIVAMDITKGILKEGVTSEIKEIIIAVVIALFIWFGLGFVLGTSIPLNAIVSCSMLPDYERGDLIILGNADDAQAPEIYIENPEEIKGINNTAVVPGELFGSEIGNVSERTFRTFDGSLYVYCSSRSTEECLLFRSEPKKFFEYHGPIKFNYGMCRRKYKDGWERETICVKSIEYVGEENGKEYFINKNNSVLVYAPKQDDLFSLTGDIIHRIYLKIDSPSGSYYLTKGDNNAVFDLQMYSDTYEMGNSLVTEEQAKGVVLFRIPYLGYAKLFLFGMWTEPMGCDSYYIKY